MELDRTTTKTKARKCDVCQRPMLAGQVKRHGVCDPSHPAYLNPLDGNAAGMAASFRSAEARWTKAHQALVDKAVEDVATVKVFFTVDDVYQLLGEDFPKSKGMASRLTLAMSAGLISWTGTYTNSQRPGNHGQTLKLWRSHKKGIKK